MFFSLYILAARTRNDETDFGKIIFFVVIAIIWGISALVSWLNKQAQEARRRQQQMQAQFQNAPPPFQPPPPPIIMRNIPPVPPQVRRSAPPQMRTPTPPQVRKPAKARRQQQKSQALVPVAEPIAPPRPIAAAPVVEIRKPPTATAPAIKTWLRPQTLHSQFILTELLRPPVALRDDQNDLG